MKTVHSRLEVPSRKKMRVVVLAVLLLFVFVPVLAFAAGNSFSLIVFPDTQYLVSNRVGLWDNICKWVVENKDKMDIKAVLSVGDITDTASQKDFAKAVRGYLSIEAVGIPCVPIVGNHDYDALGLEGLERRVSRFDAAFGPEYFSGKPYYGGNLNGSDANYWVQLKIEDRKFVILVLELFPGAQAVDWASQVIDSASDAEVIVLTHGYLNPDGSRTKSGDAYGPASYMLKDATSGEALWNNLIRKKSNIRAVICGHQIGGANAAVTQALGDNGNTVQQIFVNYQYAAGAWVGILKFLDSQEVELSLYDTDVKGGYDKNFPSRVLAWPTLKASDSK